MTHMNVLTRLVESIKDDSNSDLVCSFLGHSDLFCGFEYPSNEWQVSRVNSIVNFN